MLLPPLLFALADVAPPPPPPQATDGLAISWLKQQLLAKEKAIAEKDRQIALLQQEVSDDRKRPAHHRRDNVTGLGLHHAHRRDNATGLGHPLHGRRNNTSTVSGSQPRRRRDASSSSAVLPFCVDNDPGHVTLSTEICRSKVHGAAGGLCAGLVRIQRATCAELASHSFMMSVVEQIGLTPDSRGKQLYGNSSKAIVEVHGKAARGKVGLWQSPAQIAAALIYVGSRAEVRRYIEVGVYTAWTCSFVSTYLRRVGPRGAFRGFAVDLINGAISHGTRELLPLINVTFVFRKSLTLGTPSTSQCACASAVPQCHSWLDLGSTCARGLATTCMRAAFVAALHCLLPCCRTLNAALLPYIACL